MTVITDVQTVNVNVMTQEMYDSVTLNDNEFYVISDRDFLELDANGLAPESTIPNTIARTSQIPTSTTQLTNDSGFITGITSSNVTTALGYTPENSSNKTTVLANTSTDTQYPSAKAVYEAVHANETAISNNTSAISTINGKIPSAATSSNQLADKSFVNSSISTNTANFIGTFASVAELNAYSGTKTNNDYAFVTSTDSAGNTVYNRYKYVASTSTWTFEYALNNSSFTADQWAAINSGITSSSKVTRSSTAAVGGTTVPVYINSSGVVTAGTALNTAAYIADNTLVHLAGAETITGNKTFSGTVNLGSTAKATTPTVTSNDTSVATTKFVKDQGYKTTVTSSDVTTALGFTPVSSTVAVTHTASTAVGNSTVPVYINTSGVATTCKALNTAAYVADNTLVHLAGAETITGNKTFSGTVSLGSNATATTPTTSDSSTKLATTAFVKNQGYTSNIGTVTKVNNISPDASGNVTVPTGVEYAMVITDYTT